MILQDVSEISKITLSALQSLLTFRVGELNALTDGREVDSLILILQLKLEHRVNVPAMHQWTAQAAGGAGGSAERHARCPAKHRSASSLRPQKRELRPSRFFCIVASCLMDRMLTGTARL